MEALHPGECPAAVQLGRVLAGSLSGFGEQCGDGLPVADQGLCERVAVRCRLGSTGQDGRRGEALPRGLGLEAHVAGVEVGPAALIGPQHDAGVDADRVEPGCEVVSGDGRFLAVGGEADDRDAGAGLGVAAVGIADGAPDDLAVTRRGGQVDAGHRQVGAHRQEDDRLFGLEAEQMRDDRDQLVGGVDGESHTPEVCFAIRWLPPVLGPRWGRGTTENGA